MELPERLRDHGDQVDGEEEVLRPQGYGGGLFMNMNQSIFGLIAAAGSQADYADRFEGHSSEDEDEGERRMAETIAGPTALQPESSSARGLAQTTVLPRHDAHDAADVKAHGRHLRKLSESRLLRSVPGLARFAGKIRPSKSFKPKSDDGAQGAEATQSAPQPTPDLMPSIQITRTDSMMTAPARTPQAYDLDGSNESPQDAETSKTGPSELAKKLKEIFGFDKEEEVVEEYPCWLLQHVLLEGHMYITARHIAFYAYLPKKANEVSKKGYLSKCGKRNPKYSRYWFSLKGDVLSYYLDTKNVYFPYGQIDLRHGISAVITDGDKEGTHFTVSTDHRTYYFRADTAQSAKEWVKSLQRAIFRSHNDGDSVKISLPIENVLDVEETHMLNFADTCKIRVIDNDETYAIDEYFFSFFSYAREAINILKILVEDSSSHAHGLSDQVEPSSERTSTSGRREQASNLPHLRTGKISEGVRATLSPLSPVRGSSPSPRQSSDRPRSSFDRFRAFTRGSMDTNANIHPGSPRRRSFSHGRRSLSRKRHEGHERQESSDSYVQSLDPSQASLSAMVASASSEDASASQILRGSEVFHGPTLQHAGPSTRAGHHASDSKPPTRPATAPRQSTDAGETDGRATTPTLQSIATMGGYPLRKANALMGYLDRQSRRMSNLLATESMGYVEKVSGMWKGGAKHYDEPPELRTDEEDGALGPEEKAHSEARFRAHFTLPESEKLQAAFYAHMMRVIPLYGKIYISDWHFCFRSLWPGTRTKLILPLRDIENVDKEKGFRFGYAGLVVVIRGHEELFFEFGKAEVRDDCTITILQGLEATRYLRGSSLMDGGESEDAQAAVAEHNALEKARSQGFADHEVQLPRETSSVSEAPTIIFDDPKASFLNFKPSQPMKITCLTIGSRGDVQPYIALCKKLLEEGHHPRIATHGEFKPWIESHGIEFAYVGGDPGQLMQLCIQNGTFTWAFLKEANAKMRGFLDDLLATSWQACQGSDLIIESPSAMAGIHIAEALGIPYFRAFTMPWTRTRAYPHAFIMPGQKMGGGYNYFTYVMFDNLFWKATAGQINRWRNRMLGLPATTWEKLQVNKVPFLYNFSPYVVPPPLDYSDWIRVTGYWFLDEGGEKWTPPPALMRFIEQARADGKPLVYVGFGSIIVADPARMTQEVIDAVLKADVRCILSKGWSDRATNEKGDTVKAGAADDSSSKSSSKKAEPELPPEIFLIHSAPHDWLFRQIDAAAHHGGSGTTGASLRAGIPTIIRPFFGDQFFFGSRVEDLGVGICLKKWGANSFARALWEATHSERMIVKARVLGEQIRKVSRYLLSLVEHLFFPPFFLHNHPYPRHLSRTSQTR
ncbi:glycosyltransferase family 1 protein [Thermothielavioides terrestris NRRL 8126]|uniref:sterol 3beta-glucosyltransferase n=1 Tax=Thermothielavioides terrestris (strain ATCC 38088 / NRRL 8126) TaxID=578455 RepID=G2R6F1_THETT|nr:glycosyltransferase family 1 protein [Thermothielavioides terrestris NRRL 8126]AEO67636.1 glycosyltransferase family 1 protein [Thermothielavioides terrestris NRRL 8126]